MAEGPLAHGFDVALIGYTLAPEATLTQIVQETHEAVRFLRAGPCADAASLTVSGWSAGGHLTAMAADLPEVDAALPISGIYDIEPCRLNYLNDKLHLTEAEVTALSPIRHLPATGKPMTVAFGDNELPELQRQSVDYAGARHAAGLAADVLALPGHDHFSVLDELQKPNGKLTEALLRLVVTKH
jgi:acetyl esterase/lipase